MSLDSRSQSHTNFGRARWPIPFDGDNLFCPGLLQKYWLHDVEQIVGIWAVQKKNVLAFANFSAIKLTNSGLRNNLRKIISDAFQNLTLPGGAKARVREREVNQNGLFHGRTL